MVNFLFIDDGSIWDIGSANEDESTSVLDVYENSYVICNKTSLNQPHVLASLHLSTVISGDESGEICWNCLSKPMSINNINIISKFTVIDPETKEGEE